MIPNETVEENFKVPKQVIIEIMKDYFKKNKGLKFINRLTNLTQEHSLEKTTFKVRYDIEHRNSFTPELTIIINPIDQYNTTLRLEFQLFSHTRIFIIGFILLNSVFCLFSIASSNLFNLSAHFPIFLIGFMLLLANLGFHSDLDKLKNYFKKLFLIIRKAKHA